MMNVPLQATLRELLFYDSETGIFTWLVKRPGWLKVGDGAGYLLEGYRVISLHGRQYKAHRLAWLYMTGSWPEEEIDHKNGKRADNRWSNLRLATRSLNKQNMRKARSDNQVGLLGVSPNRKNFQAEIRLNGRGYYLGTFRTPEAAHAAYLRAKRVLHSGCTI